MESLGFFGCVCVTAENVGRLPKVSRFVVVFVFSCVIVGLLVWFFVWRL